MTHRWRQDPSCSRLKGSNRQSCPGGEIHCISGLCPKNLFLYLCEADCLVAQVRGISIFSLYLSGQTWQSTRLTQHEACKSGQLLILLVDLCCQILLFTCCACPHNSSPAKFLYFFSIRILGIGSKGKEMSDGGNWRDSCGRHGTPAWARSLGTGSPSASRGWAGALQQTEQVWDST